MGIATDIVIIVVAALLGGVIAGGGRVGQGVAQVLQRLERGFVLVELDLRSVEQAKAAGWPVIYGDASQPVVIEATGIARARLLLITIPSTAVTQAIVHQVRRHYPTVHIVARAEGIEHLKMLHDHGVHEAVQPEFEAGLEMTRQALLHLRVPATDIQRFTDAVRRELYAPLYHTRVAYQAVTQLHTATHLLELLWVSLPPESPLIGQTIQELGIRSKTGASVVGVMRHARSMSILRPAIALLRRMS